VGYSTVVDQLSLSAISKEDDPDIGILKNPRLVSETNKTLMETINSHTEKGEFIVTIGGDHSLAIGTLSGTLNAVSKVSFNPFKYHNLVSTPHTGTIATFRP
jgi:arginase